MNAKPPGDFVLAADIAGSGSFMAIGRMTIPSPALLAALQDLRDNPGDPELLEVLIYSLAVNAGGLCVPASPDAEEILQACFSARLVFEWCITFPGIGILQGLFLVSRFQATGNAAGLFDLALQLAGRPSFRAIQAEGTASS